MIDEENGTIRRVDWSEICPWLTLFRCFRLAIRFRALVLSAVAILLMLGGWFALVFLFSSNEEIASQIDPYGGCPWLVPMDWVPTWDAEPLKAAETEEMTFPDEESFEPSFEGSFDPSGPEGMMIPMGAGTPPARMGSDTDVISRPEMLYPGGEPFSGSWEHLSRSFRNVFDLEVGFVDAVFLTLSGLWAIAVWGFFGGAITRSTAVELATAGERIGWGETFRYARSKWLAYAAAPLLPLLGVFFCGVGVMAFAWLLNWTWTAWIAGLVWPLLLVFGFLMACMLLGLMFGWPLMWATISAEGTDSFDAISRSYAYVFQRPLRYLLYAVVAVVLGALGWLLVSNFAAGAIHLTYWAASWVVGSERFVEVLGGGGDSLVDTVGVGIVHFWCDCVKLVAAGFLYSFFWSASTAIYFLLRRDVDATEMDEVFQEDQSEETYGLPPVEQDDAGAPVVTIDEPAAGNAGESEESEPQGGEGPAGPEQQGEEPDQETNR